MQRLALMGGIVAALLAGSVARADETPPQSGDQQVAPASQSPVEPPVPARQGTVEPSVPALQGNVDPAAPALQGSVEPAAPVPLSKVEPAVPVPQSAIQSVAPEDAEAILGQRVTDPEGKDVGRLVDVLVDANGQPQAAIIDFGGFMGVGNRKIAVHWSALHFAPADARHKIALDMTPDQIQDAPEFRNPNKAASVVTPADSIPLPR